MKCEESAKKLIPAIRKQFVVEMLKKGKKQTEIAEILGITPAAVTQYVKGKRAKVDLNRSEKGEVAKIVDEGDFRDARICKLCKKMQKRLIDNS